MKPPKLVLIIVAFVALLLGYGLHDRSGPPRSVEPASPVHRNAANAIVVDATANELRAVPAPRREALGDHLYVRVLSDGVPAPDAEVAYLRWDAEIDRAARSNFGPVLPRLADRAVRLRVDAQGEAKVPFTEPALAIVARAPGRAPKAALVNSFDEPLDLSLERDSQLLIDVVDEQGNPFPGAQVVATFDWLWGRHKNSKVAPVDRVMLALCESRGTTDGGGRVTLGDLGTGYYVVHVSASGVGQTIQVGIELPRPPDTPALFVIGRGGSIDGVVVDAKSGLPITDARLDVEMKLGEQDVGLCAIVFTDERGQFRIEGIWADGCTARAVVFRDGYAASHIPIGRMSVGEHKSYKVRLERAVPFHGIVEVEGAGPLDDAVVMMFDEAHWTRLEMTRSRANGSFTLEATAPDSNFTLAIRGERETHVPWKFFPVIPPWQQPFRAVLDSTSPLSGHIVADGYPLEGARVRLASEVYRAERVFEQWADADPATGEFHFQSVPNGRYLLDAFANGYAPARRADINVASGANRTAVEIALERGIAVRGAVRDKSSLAPLQGAKVALCDFGALEREPRGPYGSAVETDVYGRYEFPAMQRGVEVGLVIDHPDYASLVDRFVIAAGSSSVEREHLLEKGGAIEFRAIGPEGGAVGAISVVVDGPMNRTWLASTAAEVVTIERLPPGRYYARIDVKEHASAAFTNGHSIEGVDLRAGETLELVADFSRGGVLRGRLVGGSAVLYDGAFSIAAWRQDLDSDARFPVHTTIVRRSDLGFALCGLESGDYRIQARTMDQDPQLVSEQRVTIADGTESYAEFAFGEFVLQGRITARDGTAIGGADVVVETVESKIASHSLLKQSARSTEDGSYVLGGLVAGTWGCSATATGYARFFETLTAPPRPDGPIIHDFALEPEALLRVFVVDRAGGTIGDAKIVLAPGGDASREKLIASERDSSGAAIVRGVGTGEHRLEVAREGFFPSESTLRCIGGQPLDVRVALRRPTRLELKLKNAQGGALADAPVAFTDVETGIGVDAWIARGLLPSASLVTDREGRLVVEGLPEGSYRAVARGIDVEVEAAITAEPQVAVLTAAY